MGYTNSRHILEDKKTNKANYRSIICADEKKDIIVLLSINGMRIIFPLLSLSARIHNRRVFHDVIGGSLDKYVIRYPKFKKYLKSFTVNWVETEMLKLALRERGIDNCEVIPNFKRLPILTEDELPTAFHEPFQFCTFSRVIQEKGIEEAIRTVEEINEEKGRVTCTLDIYGSIDESYRPQFLKIIDETSSAISYCGVVHYDKSVDMIKQYYALLFPTYWDSEGMPGTIVDSFSAGLPVIASDWNSNKEIIQDMYNGIIYPNSMVKTLKEAVVFSMQNSKTINEMKRACIKTAELYKPDNYIKQIIDEIEGQQ